MLNLQPVLQLHPVRTKPEEVYFTNPDRNNELFTLQAKTEREELFQWRWEDIMVCNSTVQRLIVKFQKCCELDTSILVV